MANDGIKSVKWTQPSTNVVISIWYFFQTSRHFLLRIYEHNIAPTDHQPTRIGPDSTFWCWQGWQFASDWAHGLCANRHHFSGGTGTPSCVVESSAWVRQQPFEPIGTRAKRVWILVSRSRLFTDSWLPLCIATNGGGACRQQPILQPRRC